MIVIFFTFFVITGMLILLDSFLYSEILHKFYCFIGRHTYYEVDGGGWKDFYIKLDHCKFCKKMKLWDHSKGEPPKKYNNVYELKHRKK